jgi:hypothetical protein
MLDFNLFIIMVYFSNTTRFTYNIKTKVLVVKNHPRDMRGVENHRDLAKSLQVLEHFCLVCCHLWPDKILSRSLLDCHGVQIFCTPRSALYHRFKNYTVIRKNLLQGKKNFFLCIITHKSVLHVVLLYWPIHLKYWAGETGPHRPVLHFVQFKDQLIAVAAVTRSFNNFFSCLDFFSCKCSFSSCSTSFIDSCSIQSVNCLQHHVLHRNGSLQLCR